MPSTLENSSASMSFAKVTIRHRRKSTSRHSVPLLSSNFSADRTYAGWINAATVSIAGTYVTVVANNDPVSEGVLLGPPRWWSIKTTERADTCIEHASTSIKNGMAVHVWRVASPGVGGLADDRKQGPPSGWRGACDDTDRSLQAYPKEARGLTTDLPVD